MRRAIHLCLAGVAFTSVSGAGALARLRPVPFTDVTIDDAFWAPRIRTNREVSLPHCFALCEKTGRLANFERAAKGQGKYQGAHFNDSDVFKIVEGAAYSLATHPDPKLQKLVDGVIARIAAAQRPDGYLNTFFILGDLSQRWKHIARPARHELYCAGHLIEAGAAHFEVTGKRTLLDVAVKLADHVDSVFGPGQRLDPPEHQQIEIGLVRLYRATGEKRYLRLAQFFLDQRGNAKGRKLYGPYAQDHLPVREQREAVGHAVRMMYQCAAMADVAAETGDKSLLAACRRLWDSATLRKMYITGGVGARRGGEAFGADYELPNLTAYAESCAAIGLLFFAHRMFLLEPDSKYADVVERVLYNAFLASTSHDGKRFFYVNPLESRGAHHRRPWYGCACCPSNIVRVFPTIGQYVYAHSSDALYVNLYVGSRAKTSIGGTTVRFVQKTRYPWDGKVTLTVEPARAATFDLNLRIPAWWDGVELEVNGEARDTRNIGAGYARIRREWRPGDVVRLKLHMPIERVEAHPRVTGNAGRIAFRRGPVVYCVEAVDNPWPLRSLSLWGRDLRKATHRPGLLGGVTVIELEAVTRSIDDWAGALYRLEAQAKYRVATPVVAAPYFAWDNRQPGDMVVWIPQDPALAEPLPKPTIASQSKVAASHCFAKDTVRAVNDQIEPPSSHHLGPPRLTWWDHRGTKEWVQYDFRKRQKVSAVEVYWFDDRRTGNCRVPQSWRLLYRAGKAWEPVPGASAYGTKRDGYNRVAFTPVEADGLRIEVQLQPGYSGGILEWRASK